MHSVVGNVAATGRRFSDSDVLFRQQIVRGRRLSWAAASAVAIER